MQLGEHRFAAGPVTLALQYRALMADQGVCLQVAGQIDGRERELLRFDCFVERPHYHYDPEGRNERWELDTTTCGHPLRWALTQLRTRLPAMLHKAGYAALAQQLDLAALAQRLPEVEAAAWQLARREHRTVIHNRGEVVIEAGNIRFGLEFRQLRNDRGVAIHVLGDVAGQEIELLAFDCFEVGPPLPLRPAQPGHPHLLGYRGGPRSPALDARSVQSGQAAGNANARRLSHPCRLARRGTGGGQSHAGSGAARAGLACRPRRLAPPQRKAGATSVIKRSSCS